MTTSPAPTPATTEPPADKPGMSNLSQRVIFGLIGAALLLGSVWYSAWTFALFFGAVQMRMLWEFYRMMRHAGYKPAALLGGGISILIFTVIYIYSDLLSGNLTGYPPIAAESNLSVSDSGVGQLLTSLRIQVQVAAPLLIQGMLGLILLLPVVLILREMAAWPREQQDFSPFSNVGVALLGLLYVSLPMSLLNVVAFTETGYDYRRIFALLLLVWASDTGAYAAGKTFGKHKLAPKISPGKTWEGAIGGFVLTLAVGWGLGYLLPELSLTYRLVAAGAVAVFGPLGDLAESMLKRSVGVKDSGRIMPGHGGLLDRFDAFLFILPVLALLQLLWG
ncbi:phosphatidate cytidylyltransferase [Hymenobacter endophyticus]|uniref:Phosphatidate cytidylyltransferase n=1 Tax=Hymenobacter endophyticus TaxID=3076335 RepID=A0ABU3TEW9_9BACT|nr:phosphatidate cytidylyltransferase [Hymenobacter endophyticus]MDU0369908.1 phosphatidate cytidylyltransferase [Hymenobacter endophyticus]